MSKYQPATRPSGAGITCHYLRSRDLPRLLPLWPAELADRTEQGSRRIVELLRRALRAERRRGLAGHWTYDLARHAQLRHALAIEEVGLAVAARPRLVSGSKKTKPADEAGRAKAGQLGSGPRVSPRRPAVPGVAALRSATSRGGCRGPSSSPDPSAPGHSSVQPSDSRAASPTSRGTPPATGCSGSGGDASAT